MAGVVFSYASLLLALACALALLHGVTGGNHFEYAQAIYPHLLRVAQQTGDDTKDFNENISGTPQSNGSCLVVLPVGVFGLANRLRSMSSTFALMRSHCQQKQHRCSLLVMWNTNEHCSAYFTDLFDLKQQEQEQLLHVIETNEANDSAFREGLRLAIQHLVLEQKLRGGEVALRNFLAPVDFTAVDLLLLKTLGTHAPPLSVTSCSKYLQLRSQFYALLQPSVDVAAVVQRVQQQFTRSSTDGGSGFIIGVHARAFNYDADWPVVVPSYSDAFAAAASASAPTPQGVDIYAHPRRFDEAAPIWSFEMLMRQVLQLRPDVRFFIASNSPEAARYFRGTFGSDRVLCTAAVTESDAISGSVAAAADFILLGETELLLHSVGSSFAREAAMRRVVPVIDVSVQVFDDLMV